MFENSIMKHGFMRLSLMAPLALMVLTSMGCAIGPRPLPVLNIIEHPPVSGPAATVAVFRKNQICGSYPPYYLVVDGRPIAMLYVGQHTSFQLPQGNHTLEITYFLIDKPYLVSYGLGFGRYGSTITHDFASDTNYNFLLTASCIPFDENNRVNIQKVEHWPEGVTIDQKDFVQVGPRSTTKFEQ